MTKSELHRALQAYVLATYGDGQTAPCYSCGITLRRALPGEHTGPDRLTLDRIRPGRYGGQYEIGNVRPACDACNQGRRYEEYALWLWRAA